MYFSELCEWLTEWVWAWNSVWIEITWTRSNIQLLSSVRCFASYSVNVCACETVFFCLLRTYSCVHCNCTASVYLNRLYIFTSLSVVHTSIWWYFLFFVYIFSLLFALLFQISLFHRARATCTSHHTKSIFFCLSHIWFFHI